MRLFGLKENKESPSKLCERVMSFFSEALQVDLTDSELQMVHRASSKIPTGNIRFQNLLEKELVWAAAKAKARVGDGIRWNDSNISVFPDMTKEVRSQEEIARAECSFHIGIPGRSSFYVEGRKGELY